MEAALPFTRLPVSYPLPPPWFTLFLFHSFCYSLPLSSFASRQCCCFVVVRVECRVCARENRLPVLREGHTQGGFTRGSTVHRFVQMHHARMFMNFLTDLRSNRRTLASHLTSRTPRSLHHRCNQ